MRVARQSRRIRGAVENLKMVVGWHGDAGADKRELNMLNRAIRDLIEAVEVETEVRAFRIVSHAERAVTTAASEAQK